MRMGEVVNLSELKPKTDYQKNDIRKMYIVRGDVFYANLEGAKELGKSVQSGVRPVIVISNDANNKFSPNVNIVPVTSKIRKLLPPHLKIKLDCLDKESMVLAEGIMPIGKELLKQKVGHCPEEIMVKISNKINMQLGTIPQLDEQHIADTVSMLKQTRKQLKAFRNSFFEKIERNCIKTLEQISNLYNIEIEYMMNSYDENGVKLTENRQAR